MARISRTGTTDSTGVASTTVTGSGGGRLKFISRNGRLWSNSYEIDDYLFYDEGTDTNHRTDYTTDGLSVSYDSNGTVLENTTSTSKVYILNFTLEDNASLVIEFDVLGISLSNIMRFYVGGADRYINSYLSTSETVHMKFITENNTVKFFVGDEQKGNIQNMTSNRSIRFILNNASIKFSNLKVYPLTSKPKHYTPISLSSSASIIQTGESATLTAELTNVLGEKVASKSVNFIEKSKQVFAIDGTSDTGNWNINSLNGGVTATATYSNEGTHFVATGTGASYISLYNGSTRPFDGTKDLIYEFDYKSANTSALYIINNSGSRVLIHNVSSSTDWIHEKWVYDATNKVLTAYINDVARTPVDLSAQNLTTVGFQIVDWQTDIDFWIKNFKVFQDTIIDTETTNSQGVATTTITSNGTGERQITAQADNIESEPITLKDYRYYNDGSNVSDLTIGSGVSCTSNGEYITISKSTSGESYVTLPTQLNNSENFIIEWEVACDGTNQRTAFWLNTASASSGLWCCYENGHFTGSSIVGAISTYTTSLNVGDKISLKQENGVVTLSKNDEIFFSKSMSFSSSNYKFGYYTNNGRVQCMKNIKIRSI